MHKVSSRELADCVKAREEAGEGEDGDVSVRERFVKSTLKQVEEHMMEAAGMQV